MHGDPELVFDSSLILLVHSFYQKQTNKQTNKQNKTKRNKHKRKQKKNKKQKILNVVSWIFFSRFFYSNAIEFVYKLGYG